MNITKEDILKALSTVDDPDLKKDLVNMTSNVTTTRGSSLLLPNVKNIIAVASGKGGVGKSTVTANLAVALAKSGASVGIIDADISGPSIPTMFNCEFEKPSVIQKGDKNMIVPIQQYGVKLVSIGFLTPQDGAVVWRRYRMGRIRLPIDRPSSRNKRHSPHSSTISTGHWCSIGYNSSKGSIG